MIGQLKFVKLGRSDLLVQAKSIHARVTKAIDTKVLNKLLQIYAIKLISGSDKKDFL